MSVSTWAEEEILDHVLGTTAMTVSPSCNIKLHLTDPGEDGTGGPAAETDRKAVTFGAAAAGTATSDSAAEWTAVDSTEAYDYISLWDNITAGNCLWSGQLTATVNVTALDNFTIAIGDLTVSLE
jgi:hypothetical protein